MSVQGKQTGNNGTYEFDYMRKPDDRTRWQVFRQWIYNPSKGTVLDRTAKQWGIVGLFYLVFYSVLAALVAICFWGLMSTIDYQRPTYTLDRSLIGTNPGLGFRPISNDTSERSLIWYDAKNATQIKKWTTLLDEFLELYLDRSKLVDGGKNQMHCEYDRPPVNGKACTVDLNNYGDCTSPRSYGFNNSQPCVFIKLNRIFDWVPEFYNDTENLPKEMPEELKAHIRSLKSQPAKLNTVWVSCTGEDPRANETVRGGRDEQNVATNKNQIRKENTAQVDDIVYYPKTRGFPGYYYPYRNQREYVSPVVAVQFTRPAASEVIRVECRAWAKNIVYKSQKGEKSGAVHFELMID